MSEVIQIIRAKTVSKLRKEATALKKLHKIPHHEALDLAARQFGFSNWIHLQKAAATTAISEEPFRKGLVIAMDVKDAHNKKSESDLLIEDDYVFGIFYMDYLTQRECRSHSELDEGERYFFEDLSVNYKFFRYTGQLPRDFTEAFKISEKSFFFSAEYVWLKGTLYDRWGQFDLDDELKELESDERF